MKSVIILLLVGVVAFATASPLLLFPKLDYSKEDIANTISLIKKVSKDGEFTLKDQKEFVESLSGMSLEDVLKARSEEDILFTVSPIDTVTDANGNLMLRDPREMAERLRGIPLETTTEH